MKLIKTFINLRSIYSSSQTAGSSGIFRKISINDCMEEVPRKFFIVLYQNIRKIVKNKKKKIKETLFSTVVPSTVEFEYDCLPSSLLLTCLISSMLTIPISVNKRVYVENSIILLKFYTFNCFAFINYLLEKILYMGESVYKLSSNPTNCK